MIRRKILLAVFFTFIFQIFFSTSNTLSTNGTESTSSTQSNRSKCESASIDEFPMLFFNNEQRRRGGVLLHIVLILYSFAAIEIVCDDYFASALEKISYNLNLTPVSAASESSPSRSVVVLLGCGWSDFHGAGNVRFGILYIDRGCFLRQIGYRT